ncbi:MAG TPA: hypothetical protein VND68_07230 [Chloroflexia bacterium]|jgi:hypothetical protein|nr:hypothetical protein [Chloroflexia bacterium]
MEFVAGVAILLGVFSFALHITIEQNAQYEHYTRAQEAEQRKDYGLSLAEYSAAGAYRDTSLRSARLRERIAERDKEYTIALQHRKSGKWWQAARSLLEVEEFQPNYRDARRQLADVRRVNGVIFYKRASAAGDEHGGGIFVAYADGGDPLPLPLTGPDSAVLAVSPDSRWVAYDLDTRYGPAIPRALYLYDVASRAAYPLHVPAAYFPDPIAARFAPESQTLWLNVDGTGFSYSLPGPGSEAQVLRPDSTPATQAPRRMEHDISVRSVTLLSDWGVSAGNEVLVVSTEVGPGSLDAQPGDVAPGTARLVAVEHGIVDGAVFSANGDLLLYRVCGELDREGSYVCRLRLVDVALHELHPNTLATITVRGRDMQDWDLTGGFTRDGRHVLLIEMLRGETTVRLYTPNSGDAWTLDDEASLTLAAALCTDALVPLGVPGLSRWTGKNALSHVGGAIPLPEARGTWPQRYFGGGFWVAASPSDRYLLYLDVDDTPPGGGRSEESPFTYSLYSAPFRSNAPGDDRKAARRLLSTPLRPDMWLSSMYMLPEGKTLLSTRPPQPHDRPGLYAYDLQTGEHVLAIPGVTDLWRPGYYTLQPEVPVFDPGE